jgi:hypothetical protein
MTNDNKIRVAIWKMQLPSVKSVLIGILLLAAFAFAILHKIPMGPTKKVTAQVEAIGVTHGATGSGRYLICVLDSGRKVKVFLDEKAPLIQQGEIVKLREYTLSFGRKSYQLSSSLM